MSATGNFGKPGKRGGGRLFRRSMKLRRQGYLPAAPKKAYKPTSNLEIATSDGQEQDMDKNLCSSFPAGSPARQERQVPMLLVKSA